jgi:hypothetical protein
MDAVRWLGAIALAAVLCWGCVSVDYVGKSYSPTASVDLYMTPGDVKRHYEVMGEVRASVEVLPFSNPSQQLQTKLLAEAQSRGANGLILGALSSHERTSTATTTGTAQTKKKGDKKNTQYVETTTTNTEQIDELRGTLIRYTD